MASSCSSNEPFKKSCKQLDCCRAHTFPLAVFCKILIVPACHPVQLVGIITTKNWEQRGQIHLLGSFVRKHLSFAAYTDSSTLPQTFPKISVFCLEKPCFSLDYIHIAYLCSKKNKPFWFMGIHLVSDTQKGWHFWNWAGEEPKHGLWERWSHTALDVKPRKGPGLSPRDWQVVSCTTGTVYTWQPLAKRTSLGTGHGQACWQMTWVCTCTDRTFSSYLAVFTPRSRALWRLTQQRLGASGSSKRRHTENAQDILILTCSSLILCTKKDLGPH